MAELEMSIDELEKLLNGEGKLIFSDKKIVDKKKLNELQSNDPIIAQLRQVNNRQEATKLLSSKGIFKNDLINIASFFKVHINKSDNKAKIIEKIIEATVGAILRSKAIKETNHF